MRPVVVGALAAALLAALCIWFTHLRPSAIIIGVALACAVAVVAALALRLDAVAIPVSPEALRCVPAPLHVPLWRLTLARQNYGVAQMDRQCLAGRGSWGRG